jgi:hypothetical protein
LARLVDRFLEDDRRGEELPELRPLVRLRGTFAPFLRASDSPIAIACLRLVTFLPLRPLLSEPRFLLRIADSTDLLAWRPYRAMSHPPSQVRALSGSQSMQDAC